MRKAFKKLLATLLALAMVCALAAPVWADDGTFGTTRGSITIDNAANGETYNLYRIFKLNSFDGVLGHYSYTVEANWKPFFEGSAAGADYITLDTNGHPTWKTGKNNPADHAEFAKKALAWATERSITAIRTQTATSDTVLFSDLDIGYYLVDTSLGSLCGLTTTDANVTITEKNPKPTLSFHIGDKTGTATEIHSATNKIIPYHAVITMNKGTDNLKFEVRFPKGLTYKQDLTSTDATPTTHYTATFDESTSKLTITFPKSFLDTISVEQTVNFDFSASVNAYNPAIAETCIIDGAGNIVTGQLFYGNASSSTQQKLTTYVHQFDLIKYDGDNKKLLDGAEFEVYETAMGGSPIKFGTLGVDEWYVAAPGEGSTTTTVSSLKQAVSFYGLGGDAYYLEEVKAPDGYNKAEGRIRVNLTTDSIKSSMPDDADTYEASYGGIAVENKSGIILPSTGGIGTTIFYVVGGLLMVGAAVLLVTKKRMENN